QIRPLFRRARIIGRRFQLVHVVFGQEIIETSTFRAPAEAGDQATDEHGRILRDNLFGTHEQDAARRDFTLNALYYDPIDEVVIDYHRGVADLKKRVVRMIGDPDTRYREDPVRMLRAVRFACKLGGTIDPATLAPIARLAPLIQNVPASRLFDEMLKLLTCGHAMTCLRQLRDLGLLQGMLPVIDTLLQTPEGEEFVSLALERTDARVRAGKSVSASFLFAALRCRLVDQRGGDITADGEHPVQALRLVADDVIDRQARTLAIQRRFQADLREIWFLQPRFEKAPPRAIWRMLDHQRFRAADDFLQLRAEAREVDSVQAQWWMDLANADTNDRARMIDDYQRQNAGSASNKPRKRRRRRKPSAAGSDSAP